MRFKAGFIAGLIVGIVIGARMGKERYDKLVARMRSTLQSETVQQATDLAERSTRKSRAAAGRGLVGIADTMRENASS